MKKVVILVLLVFGLMKTGCLNVPVGYTRFDYIRAVSWNDAGQPVALAVRMSVYKGAYPLTIEGAGVYTSYDDKYLLLIVGKKRNQLRIPPALKKKLDDYELDYAYTFQGGQFFLADMSTRSSFDPHVWLRVGFDGSVSEFDIAALDHTEDFEETTSPGQSDLLFGQGRYIKTPGIFVYVPEAGAFQILREFFVSARKKPAQPSNVLKGMAHQLYPGAVSPSGHLGVIKDCGEYRGKTRCGLWVVNVKGERKFLYPGPTYDLGFDEPGSLKDEVYPTVDDESLVWSPDNSRVYWHYNDSDAGMVVPLSKQEPVETYRPGLKLAAWSPDGKRIAGVADHKLTVIRVK